MKTRAFAVALFAALLTGATAVHAENMITADSGTLNPNTYERYSNIYVAGGEHAAAVVQGDGNSQLRVSVFDSNNNLVEATTCQAQACVVSWEARWNADFYVTVENIGGTAINYGFAMKRF